MVQIKKEEIDQRIRKVARDLFLDLGYQKVSMRRIASQCQVSVSNLYTYYRKKEDLFDALAEPVLSDLQEMGLDRIPQEWRTSPPAFKEDLDRITGQMVAYIWANQEALRLLFHKAEGSHRGDFRQDLITRFVRMEQKAAEEKGRLEHFSIEISPQMVEGICSLYIHAIDTFLREKQGEEQLKDHIKTLNRFVKSGLTGIMDSVW